MSAPSDLQSALAALGAKGDRPHRPVMRGRGGLLVTVGLLDPSLKVVWAGVWIHDADVRFFGPTPPASGSTEFHNLSGPSARLVDLFAEAARVYLERTEEVDEKVAGLQQRGREVPLAEIWSLQRRTGAIRLQIGRALVAVAETEETLADGLPDAAKALPSVRAELARVRDMAANVQQSVSDFLLLRQADEANRLAETTNDLSKVSNRIAALSNISNIRMLGVAYIALVLAIVSAVVLIPNTGATILGMPTAAWVPGYVVDAALVVLTIVPMVVVFSRRWVRDMLRGFRSYETPTTEGLSGLAEISPEAAAEEPNRPRGGIASPGAAGGTHGGSAAGDAGSH